MPASEDFTPLDTLKRYLSLPRRTIEEGLSSLASLPQRAFQASEQMRNQGPYDPAPAIEAAMLPMGTGAVAGVRAAAGEKVLGAGPIRAYHSSPHDFDKFDLAKIGTGEGAQVYGHGLYFAENPAVSGQGGEYWKQFLRRFKGDEETAARRLQASGFDRETAARLTQEAKDRYTSQPSKYLDPATVAQRQADLQRQHELLTSGKPVGPRTYEVNIKADPAQMLNWDTKIGQQPAAVQDYFRKQIAQFGPEASMEAQYKIASSRIGGRKLAEGLTEAGVPGTRYLDEGSRGPQIVANLGGRTVTPRPQTSNYVIRDPTILDIVKKYGLAGLASAPALTSSLRDKEAQP